MNSRPHKQSMSELKLRRLTEHNQRLREDLARPRVRVSEASARYVSSAYIQRNDEIDRGPQLDTVLQNHKRPPRALRSLRIRAFHALYASCETNP